MRSNKAADWEIFAYEANMLCALYMRLIEMNAKRKELEAAQGAVAPEDEWLYRAVLESELLHIRALARFFLYKPNDKYPDDLRLAHLLSDYKHPKIEELRREYGDKDSPLTPCYEINKRLAHVTNRHGDVYDWTKPIHRLVSILTELIEDVWAHRPHADRR